MSEIYLNGELAGVCSEELAEGVGKYCAKLEADNKALRLKLRAALRECDHCGALMPPATTLRGERL